MCGSSSEEPKPTGPIHKKPSGHVVFHLFISAFSLFFVVVTLLIPSDSAGEIQSAGEIPLSNSAPTGNYPALATPSNRQTAKRGKFVGATFDARNLYDAYKEIQSEYHQKAFSPANHDQWRILAQRDDVEVAMMEHSSDPNCPYVRLKAVIRTPVEDCWNFLLLEHWDETMPKMDPFYEGVELHGDFTHKGVHMILARKRTQRILAFGKRDFVFLSVTDQPLQDGTWVSGSVSVQTPKIPRQNGYTRAFQDSIAFYKPLDDNTKTQVTIVCRIDLNDSSEEGDGGWMPMWLYVKTIGATGAKSVINMRTVLVEAQQKRQDQPKQKTTQAIPGRNRIPFWKKRKASTNALEVTPSPKRRRFPWQPKQKPELT